MYETTYSGGIFVGELYTPTKIGLTDQTKVALLKYLTGSDEFHKLVCDITGVERKEEKVYIELEKVKADYLYMCERYKQEQVKNKALIQRWKDEEAKRMKTQAALEDSHSHHNNVMNRIKDLLKEVDMPSVKHTIEALKSERANGKLFAEKCELLKEENDILSKRFSDLENSYFCIHKEANEIKNSRKNLLAKYIEENKRLTDKVEKLKGKLDKSSKRYGELIKIISDRAIKSI
nr:MAG TPA: hypothetical protein [Caudoviricetes sp.]